jgi:hypothetical protein
MLVQVLSLVIVACLFGFVASVIVYRAGSVAPVWSMAVAVVVLLVLTATILAIFVFAKNRAFPT